MNKSGLKSLSQAFRDSLWGHLHKHTTVLVITSQNSKSWVFASVSATHLTCIVPLDHQLSYESGTVTMSTLWMKTLRPGEASLPQPPSYKQWKQDSNQAAGLPNSHSTSRNEPRFFPGLGPS